MKTRLDQFTLSEFVELLAGDISVLSAGSLVKPKETAAAARDVINEYARIVYPGGNSAYLTHFENNLKTQSGHTLWAICKMLVGLNEFDGARIILGEYGFDADKWDNKRIEREVNVAYARSKRDMDESAADNDEDVDIGEVRNHFDQQTALLMAHYKFQIDPMTIRASIYANLVARYQHEIKTMKSSKRQIP